MNPSIVLPLIPGPRLKRKREEVADSQSEEEDIASDEEFGWAGEDSLVIDGPDDNQGHISTDEIPILTSVRK